MHCSIGAQLRPYSITSSARVSSDGGIFRPSAFAGFMFMINANLVGCSTRHFRGRCTSKYSINVGNCAAKEIRNIWPVRDQFSRIHEFLQAVHGRHVALASFPRLWAVQINAPTHQMLEQTSVKCCAATSAASSGVKLT
jgi:hypothetical protein